MERERKWDWARIVLCVIALKVLLLLWGVISFDFVAFPDETWWGIWHRWDIVYFERIAEHLYLPGEGFETDQHEFLSHIPPGFPAAIAVLRACGLPLIFSGFAVSNFSFILACLILYELMLFEFRDRRIALRTVFYLNVFPSSYFTLAPYSESLFLLLSVLIFYLLRVKKDFVTACLIAFFAVTTRWVGVTLVPAIIFEGLRLYRAGGMRLRNFAALLFPLLGILIFFLINRNHYGDYFAFREHQQRNGTITTLQAVPFRFTWQSLRRFADDPETRISNISFMMSEGWPAMFLLLSCAAAFAGRRKIPVTYSIYAATYLLFVSCLSWAISTVRFLLLVFPIFMSIACSKNRLVILGVALSFGAFLLYFSRYFVQGEWAI